MHETVFLAGFHLVATQRKPRKRVGPLVVSHRVDVSVNVGFQAGIGSGDRREDVFIHMAGSQGHARIENGCPQIRRAHHAFDAPNNHGDCCVFRVAFATKFRLNLQRRRIRARRVVCNRGIWAITRGLVTTIECPLPFGNLPNGFILNKIGRISLELNRGKVPAEDAPSIGTTRQGNRFF